MYCEWITKSIFKKYFLKEKKMVSKGNSIKDVQQIMQSKNNVFIPFLQYMEIFFEQDYLYIIYKSDHN